MLECIIVCALCVVGVVQMLKNFVGDWDVTTPGTKKIRGFALTLIVVLVSVAVVLIYEMLPSIIIECILVLSAASLFYDTIYKGFESIIKYKLQNRQGDTNG